MAGFGFLAHPLNYVNRYRQIAGVLIKYGFDDLLARLNVKQYLPSAKHQPSEDKEPKEDISGLARYERMRLVLEELGPTFIKFGQIMSNRPDLLPPQLVGELEKLQDQVPPFDSQVAKETVETELGYDIDTIFKHFDEAPFSSASVAQVHQAILHNGQEVALKIQRPQIWEVAEVDLEILKDLAALAQRYIPSMAYFDPVGIVQNVEKVMKKELSFTMEAAYLERFKYNFSKFDNIYIPDLYKEYTTEKVLTLEYIDGIKISEIEKLEANNYDLKLIAQRGFNAYLTQVFEFGLFHGDPHPGNILIISGNKLCYLDFGMTGLITEADKSKFSSILIGFRNKDTRRIIRALQQLSGNQQIEDVRKLEYELNEFISDFAYRSLEDVNVSDIIERFRTLILDFRIQIQPDFFLLMKAFITMDGLGRKLAPDFNPVEEIQPYIARLERQRLNPFNLMHSFYLSSMDFGNFLKDLPFDLKDLIDQAKKGEININLEHKGLTPLLTTFDQVSNRIAFVIVLASLIIGSSLIVLSGIPPTYKGIPLIGIIGFIIAGLMGLWLLFSILKHRKM